MREILSEYAVNILEYTKLITFLSVYIFTVFSNLCLTRISTWERKGKGRKENKRKEKDKEMKVKKKERKEKNERKRKKKRKKIK